MKLKNYQKQALERIETWLENIRKSSSLDTAWAKMDWHGKPARTTSRYNGMNVLIPHACIKVPTGGGKTLLAVESLARRNKRTGLVLWMVPSTTIYKQTKNALWDKEHPYRQVLERTSGGRVKVLEKNDPFSLLDTTKYLCVMLISLQSANRKNNKEFLRIFRESGLYSTFFPEEDDDANLARFLENHPTLTKTQTSSPEHTLANVIRVCKPVVILDEAHKAYGRSHEKLNNLVNDFDPSLVLEFSATPNELVSNILVDVAGRDLKEEEMIKLPIHVLGYPQRQWEEVLTASSLQLKALNEKAELYSEQSGKYIRPIAIVRVPRTGANQRGKGFVHSEDVREYLIKYLSIPTEQIRVQSSETKELDGEDLMSKESQVRWIITKDALKEGWDCPFAYLLIALDGTTAITSVTQMVGRILRQPSATLTGVDELDQCYVFCWNNNVDNAVSKVKEALEKEGLGDLSNAVVSNSQKIRRTRIKRREGLISLPTQLPQVLWNGEEEIDYEKHILSKIDWTAVTPPIDWDNLIPDSLDRHAEADITEDNKVHTYNTNITSSDTIPKDEEFDLLWYTKQVSVYVPNPWQAARLVMEASKSLCDSLNWEASEIQNYQTSFLGEIIKTSRRQIDEQAEEIFRKLLKSGEITFDMVFPFEYSDYYEISLSSETTIEVQRSLFDPMYKLDLNDLEVNYAIYLDQKDTIRWWHRIAARSPSEYKLQGWRESTIYPDFVALQHEGKILIHETKGSYLSGNDTEYKKRLFECLQQNFNSSGTVSIKGATMKADFKILFDEDLTAIK